MSDDLKSKVVTVVDCGLFVDIALKIAPAFKHVYYWSPWQSAFPKSNSLLPGDGFDDIERVKWLFKAIEKSDLVIFPDVYFGDLQIVVEQMGKAVWGSRRGECLELDRWGTKQMLKELGMPVSRAVLVRGTSQLRDYLKDNPNVWVKISTNRGDAETFQSESYELISPRIDELEYKLGGKKEICEFIVEDHLDAEIEVGYDGFCIDGNFPKRSFAGFELKDAGFIGSVKEYKELPDFMREPNDKLAPFFEQHRYRGFYSSELRVTKDKTAYLIDPCCYSEDTDILTDKGWKRISALDHTEKVCTLNPETRNIEYQRPSDYVSYQFSGNMVRFTSPKSVIDLLVTPNHSMWVSHRDKHATLEEFRADAVCGHSYLPRTGEWVGESPEFFVLPEYHSEWISGKGAGIYKRCDRETIRIPIRTWIQFLAFYLSEGNCDEWCVHISQTKHKDAFRKVIASLPFKWTEHRKGFRLFDVQLVSYLQRFPKRHERGIDPFVKELSPGLINLFLDAYCLGDGNRKGSQRIFTTTSRLSADDLQELCLKSGSCADISVGTPAGTPVAISGGKYTSKHDALLVRERKTFDTYYFEGWNTSRHALYLSRQAYDGRVYCVTVPNHIVYVRRNGKPVFSGNCRAASPPHEIYLEIFDNWPEIFWHGANGRVVDPDPVARYGVCAMIHSSWATRNWLPLKIPDAVRRFVKIRNHCRIDGVDYFVPQPDSELPEIGAVIGLGDTLEDAIAQLEYNAEQIKGYSLEIKLDAIPEAMQQVERGKELGIDL